MTKPNGTTLTATGTNVPRVAPGTAEQLARIARFRALETVQPEELDAVAHWLIGRVGASHVAQVWEQIQDDCHRLWFLITDDWDDRDLDELSADDRRRFDFQTEQQETDHRYGATRARLADDIESVIWLARYRADEAARRIRSAR